MVSILPCRDKSVLGDRKSGSHTLVGVKCATRRPLTRIRSTDARDQPKLKLRDPSTRARQRRRNNNADSMILGNELKFVLPGLRCSCRDMCSRICVFSSGLHSASRRKIGDVYTFGPRTSNLLWRRDTATQLRTSLDAKPPVADQ